MGHYGPENITKTGIYTCHTTTAIATTGIMRSSEITYIWNSQLSVSSDDIFEVSSAVVTVFTQLEAERPIRRHYW